MKKILQTGLRVLVFEHPADEPYLVDVWLAGEPVWTFMVEERDVSGNVVLVFPTLPKDHFAFEVELTPTETAGEHKVVVPAKALGQLVSEFRLSRDDLVRSSFVESDIGVGNGQAPHEGDPER